MPFAPHPSSFGLLSKVLEYSLVRMDFMPRLVSLDLSRNLITHEGIDDFLCSMEPYMPNLKTLRLNENPLLGSKVCVILRNYVT